MVYGFYNYTYHNQTDAFYNDNFTSLLEQQSVYISLLVNFALFVIGYKVVNKKTSSPLLLIAGGFFLVLISYFLGSRINIGVLAMIAVSFGFYYLITNKKILETATLCLGLIMAGVIVYKVQPQMLNRFKELTYNKYEYSNMGAESHYGMELEEDQWNGANFRLAAWSCGWEIFTENPVVGVGLGDKKDRLFSKYEQKDFQFAIQTNKNVHSNYIDVLYSLGVVGFFLFVFTWLILPFVHALKHRNWLGVVFIFSLACAWVTEIYFDRSLGGMITGFFIPFILIGSKEE
ncbi:O-antigen ligase family protein [Pontibacter sp. H249]|uniref:O-antigen ligase family protein n=1 Tax=Pontibacter sp. H249 TaxID=3133420 RepID=UPI0030BF2738